MRRGLVCGHLDRGTRASETLSRWRRTRTETQLLDTLWFGATSNTVIRMGNLISVESPRPT